MTMGETAPDAAPAPGRRRAESPKRRTRSKSTTRNEGDRRSGRRPGRPSRRSSRDGALRAPGLPRPSLQSRGWRYGLTGGAVALLLGWLVWYAATPEELPTSDRTVNASGVVGKPLYIGMFAAKDDFDRTIRISGVKVHTTASQEITVTPLLCRQGAVGVTTAPAQFCSELVDPKGERLVGGDSIVLKVEADKPALAVIDQVRVAYREDVRWDTQPAGNHQAIVSLAGRDEE